VSDIGPFRTAKGIVLSWGIHVLPNYGFLIVSYNNHN